MSSLAFAPDGHRLAAGGGNGVVKLWELIGSAAPTSLKGHTAAVTRLAFSPDGQRLLTASFDGTARLWDTTTDPFPLALHGHTAAVHGLAFSPDGRILVSGAADETARVWDARTGEQLHKLSGLLGGVNGVSFRPGGRHFALATTGNVFKGKEGEVIVCEAATAREVFRVRGHGSSVNLIGYSPDSAVIASASLWFNRSVILWDADTGRRRHTLVGHKGALRSFAFSPNGRWLATVGAGGRTVVKGKQQSEPGMVKLWEVATGKEIATYVEPGAEPSLAEFSPDGQRLAIRLSQGSGYVTVVVAPPAKKPLLRLPGHFFHAFSPDGRRFVSLAGELCIGDVATGRRLVRFPGVFVRQAFFSKSGKRLIVDSGTGLRVLDASGQDFAGFGGPTTAGRVIVSPDGRRLAHEGLNFVVHVWDTAATEEAVLARRRALAANAAEGWHWDRAALVPAPVSGLESSSTWTRRWRCVPGLRSTERCAAMPGRPWGSGKKPCATMRRRWPWVLTFRASHEAALLLLRRKDHEGYRGLCARVRQRCLSRPSGPGLQGSPDWAPWACWICAWPRGPRMTSPGRCNGPNSTLPAGRANCCLPATRRVCVSWAPCC